MKKRIIIAVAVLLTAMFAIMANNTNVFKTDEANAGCTEVWNGTVEKVCKGIFGPCHAYGNYVCHGKHQ